MFPLKLQVDEREGPHVEKPQKKDEKGVEQSNVFDEEEETWGYYPNFRVLFATNKS